MPATQRDIRVFEQGMGGQSSAPAQPPLGSGLGLGPKLPQIITSSPAMDQAVTGILGQHKQLNAQLPGLQADVEAKRQALGAEIDTPMPAAPKLNAIPEFQPRQVSGEEMMMFSGIAMALAGLGTVAMRGDMTMALNAAGSAMRGFNEGNLQQSRLDLENFKKKMDSVIAENHRMSDEYRQIIENRKLSLAQKSQALQVAAAARDDQIMLSALQSGQLKTVFDLESHRINATNAANLRATEIYNSLYGQMGRDEPLVAVQETDGTVRYKPRSQAVGGIVPPRTQGDRLTESEGKGTLFWRQMSSAEEAARAAAGPQFNMANVGSQLDVKLAGSDLTNWAASDSAQRYAQAAEQWAEAYLRLKTGAATNQDEIRRNARAYFPQPGDKPEVIAQKNDMRAKAIEDVSIIAGRGVQKSPAGGGMSFGTEAEAAQAAAQGKIKPGDRITVGGRSGTWR